MLARITRVARVKKFSMQQNKYILFWIMIFWLLNFDNFLLQHDMSSSKWSWNIENEKMDKWRTI